MSPPPLDTLQARFAQISPKLISPEAIHAAQVQGEHLLISDPIGLLRSISGQARTQPVLAAASGLGAVQAAEQTDGAHSLAYARLALGSALIWWGYHHEARSYLSLVDAALEGSADSLPLLYARWHSILATRRFGSVPDEAEQLLRTAQQLEDLGDPVNAMRCRQDVVSELFVVNHYDRAIAILDSIRDFFAAQEMPGDLGMCYIHRALAHSRRGEFEEWLAALDLSDSYLQRGDCSAAVGFAWYLRGLYYAQQRQIAHALHWLNAACHRAIDLRHLSYQTICLLEIANTQRVQGDLRAALRAHAQIEELASELKLVFLIGSNALRAANIHLRQGDHERAAEGYRRARRVFKSAGCTIEPAVCLMNLGIVARRQGRFAESLQLLHEARAVFEISHSHEDLANVHHNLGKTYAGFGYLEPALEHLQICLDEVAHAGAPTQAALPAMYMAAILAEKGEFEQAERLLEQAADLTRQAGLDFDAAVCERIRGDVLLRQGQENAALRAYKLSQARLHQMEQFEAAWEARLGVAETYLARADIAAAELELEQLADASLPVGLRWRYHTLVARSARTRGCPAQALESYLHALDQVSAARRGLEREEQAEQFTLMLQSVYDDAFALALDLGDSLHAVHIAELHSAQLLNTRLGYTAAPARPTDGLLPALIDQLNRQLGKAWTTLRYAWHGNDLWLFILTPDGLEMQAVPLDPACRMALRACTSPDDSFRQFIYLGKSSTQANAAQKSRNSRHRLGHSLIPPSVLERLGPTHTLIVIPSRELHGLPFHTLLIEERPLIEYACVSYAQSLDMLAVLYERRPQHSPKPAHGLVLAQAEFEDRDDLPHVLAEADAVAGWAAPYVVRPDPDSLGRETLSELNRTGRLADYTWLHIATHAHPDEATGYFTGLRLGRDVIDLEEIRQWRLGARLVTLSACQTGQGRWYYGDEIAGLAQAFLSAGAQSIIASLWLAADEFTAQLMTMFYQALSAASSPAAALASAQRESVQMGIAPYYWAPFNVFGLP